MIWKKVPNRSKGSSAGARIDKLADYVISPELELVNEKCLFQFSGNFATEAHEARKLEMRSLAMQAPRSKDPISHYVVSWKAGELPSKEQLADAIKIILKELGLERCLWLAGYHVDTENRHLHLAILRVDPDSFRMLKAANGRDRKAGQRALARIVHRQGWEAELGAPCAVVGDQVVWMARGSRSKGPSSPRMDKEVATGEQSVERLAGIAASILKQAQSWSDVHTLLAEAGFLYQPKGKGAVLLFGEIAVKASSAGYGASLAKLVSRLGPFEPPASEVVLAAAAFVRTPRAVAGAGEGWAEYSQQRTDHAEARLLAQIPLIERQQNEADTLKLRLKRTRTNALAGDWKGFGWERTAIEQLLAITRRRDQAALKTKHKTEVAAFRVAHPSAFPNFASWHTARGRDDLAQAYRYRADPQTPTLAAADLPLNDYPPVERDEPRRIGFKSVAVRDRSTHYFRDSAAGQAPPAFIDRGATIEVLDWRDRHVRAAALSLAADKFGKIAILSGSAEFKKRCIESAVRAGIEITNPELQPAIQAEKDRVARDRRAILQAVEIRNPQHDANTAPHHGRTGVRGLERSGPGRGPGGGSSEGGGAGGLGYREPVGVGFGAHGSRSSDFPHRDEGGFFGETGGWPPLRDVPVGGLDEGALEETRWRQRSLTRKLDVPLPLLPKNKLPKRAAAIGDRVGNSFNRREHVPGWQGPDGRGPRKWGWFESGRDARDDLTVVYPDLDAGLRGVRYPEGKLADEDLAQAAFQFGAYLAAVQPDRIVVTTVRYDEKGQSFNSSLLDDDSSGFTPEELVDRVPELKRLEGEGLTVFFKPVSSTDNRVVVQGLSRAGLDRLGRDGYSPSAVMQSGNGVYEAILRSANRPLATGSKAQADVGRSLNRRYGGVGEGVPAGAHVAPGFRNRHPSQQMGGQTYQPSRLLAGKPNHCAQIQRDLQRASEAERRRKTETDAGIARELLGRLLALTRHTLAQATFLAHLEDLRRLASMDAPENTSSARFMIAVRLRGLGHSESDVAAILLSGSSVDTLSQVGLEDRAAADAATISKAAFGVRGDRSLALYAAFRPDWEALEARVREGFDLRALQEAQRGTPITNQERVAVYRAHVAFAQTHLPLDSAQTELDTMVAMTLDRAHVTRAEAVATIAAGCAADNIPDSKDWNFHAARAVAASLTPAADDLAPHPTTSFALAVKDLDAEARRAFVRHVRAPAPVPATAPPTPPQRVVVVPVAVDVIPAVVNDGRSENKAAPTVYLPPRRSSRKR